ncbi:MAG: ArnT family glycosyltransferase [Anaerolineae bacterium]
MVVVRLLAIGNVLLICRAPASWSYMVKHIRKALSPAQANVSKNASTLGLLLILALGGLVRLWGNDFGLPYLYHPDEGYLVMPALKILHTGNFNPGWFDYGSVFIYVLFLTYVVYFLAGARLGVFQVVQDIPYYENFREISAYDFPTLFIVSRSVSALFGMALIPIVYLLAKRLFGEKVGLVASLLLALCPALVYNAHFATTDTAMTTFVTLAVLLSLRLYESGERKYYALAGFVTGLAISTKYSAFPAVLTLAVAHLLRGRKERSFLDHNLFLALGTVLVGFLIGSPFVLAEFPTFLNYLAKQIRVYGRPGGELPLEATYVWWLKYMFTTEVMPATILALVGVGYLLKEKPRETALLLASPALFWIIILTQIPRYHRSWLPTAPILVLLAAYGLARVAAKLSEWFQKIRPVRQEYGLALLLLPLVIFWGAIVLQRDWRMTQPDVRTLALNWIQEHLPINSRIAIDLTGPPLPSPPWQVGRYGSLGNHPLAYYQEQGYEYLIISQRAWENPSLTQTTKENLQSIEEGTELVADLIGFFLYSPDCHLWIYKVPERD